MHGLLSFLVFTVHTPTSGHSSQHTQTEQLAMAMELLLLPSRAAASRPLLPASPLRGAGATTFRLAVSSSGNVEVTDTTATATASRGGVAKNRQEWRAAGGQAPFGLGLDLSEEMRRGMMWRMLVLPAAAVAAEAVFLRVLDGAAAGDAPPWAGKAGSAVLFAAGLLGSHYGFLSSRWNAAETGSVVGWELAVQHWNALSMAKDSSMEEEEEDDDDEDGEEYEDEDEDEDEEYEYEYEYEYEEEEEIDD